MLKQEHSGFKALLIMSRKDCKKGLKSMGKLFGTDGIRGTANIYPMTPETALEVGRAAAYKFRGTCKKTSIVIGKDTSISWDMLESALISGICSAGADSCTVGFPPLQLHISHVI